MESENSRYLPLDPARSICRSPGDIIGRYERDEVTPSVEVASKLSDVLDVSLDYLSGKTDTELDSATLGRIREISVMPEDDKKQVFLVLDALIRDYKARKTYAQ